MIVNMTSQTHAENSQGFLQTHWTFCILFQNWRMRSLSHSTPDGTFSRNGQFLNGTKNTPPQITGKWVSGSSMCLPGKWSVIYYQEKANIIVKKCIGAETWKPLTSSRRNGERSHWFCSVCPNCLSQTSSCFKYFSCFQTKSVDSKWINLAFLKYRILTEFDHG